MVQIIDTATRSLSDAGDSRRVSIVKSWLSILGFESADEIEIALLHSEKHGFLFGAWKPDDQPDIEDINLEELEEDLSEKVDILDDSN